MNHPPAYVLAKRIVPALFAVLLLCAGCDVKKEKAPEKKIIPVSVAPIQERAFEDIIKVEGTVEPVDHAELCSRVAGVIDCLMVDEGSAVKKGDELFQIDKVNLENSLEVARENLNVAEAAREKARIETEIARISREKAEKDFERSRKLKDSNAVSEDEFEKAELVLKKCLAVERQMESELLHAEAVIGQAKSNVGIATKELEDSMIKAPFDGVITDKFKELGEYADKSDRILRMENPSSVEVVALISAKHYASVVPGRTLARISSGGSRCDALVSYRSPSIDPDGRTFEMKIRLPADSGLVSGMLCEVKVVVETRKGVGAPTEAIVEKSGGRKFVFILNDGKAELCPVKTGIESDGCTEIFCERDISRSEVIISGQRFLEDGSPVKKVEGENGAVK